MEIVLFDETKMLKEEHQQLIYELLMLCAQKFKIEPNAELSVSIIDNHSIQEINKQYRGKNYPTDVISFAMEDEQDDELFIDLNDEIDLPRVLGDLFISYERVVQQAEEYGHSFERELGFLIVHGFLHLNGYDHGTENEEKEMFTIQEKILGEYGLER